ncbi:hypothetical protein J2Z69_003529 [Paenibacillus shirakamiensis]|uniref:Uncharacterized protein n=1 Tax=Paenibacillus shirakamiensis TaxID=1265935 RepID=A0ABS4JMU3_9BACL|nr:hypothetical protein [Paenibacillus shirakamiensis]MBP2002456.1 hypothetical protein [Paenibacillus shirakamiensis]
MFSTFALLLSMMSPLTGPTHTIPHQNVMVASVQYPWTVKAQTSSAIASSETELKPIEYFNTLNDIALSDQRSDVIRIKGEPNHISTDSITGYTEYHYNDTIVGMYEDHVYYVHVNTEAQQMKINDEWISLQPNVLRQTLGNPDYKAEDGDVYMKESGAIKIYKDATQSIKGIDLFDDSNS